MGQSCQSNGWRASRSIKCVAPRGQPYTGILDRVAPGFATDCASPHQFGERAGPIIWLRSLFLRNEGLWFPASGNNGIGSVAYPEGTVSLHRAFEAHVRLCEQLIAFVGHADNARKSDRGYRLDVYRRSMCGGPGSKVRALEPNAEHFKDCKPSIGKSALHGKNRHEKPRMTRRGRRQPHMCSRCIPGLEIDEVEAVPARSRGPSPTSFALVQPAVKHPTDHCEKAAAEDWP